MDIYTGPVGSASVTTQIHDYSPGIGANGLFWVIPVPEESVAIDLENGSASLRLSDIAVMDAHDIANALTNGHGLVSPPIPPKAPVPATVSFDIEWSGLIAESKIVNEAENFRANHGRAAATVNENSGGSRYAPICEASIRG